MWRRAALCAAGWAGITGCAVLAEETTHIVNPDAPQGAFVAYLDDDPPTTQTRATCVLRMLETLGVRRPGQPSQLPAPNGTEARIPAALAANQAPPESVTADALQEESLASRDDARTSPLVATSPHFFGTQQDETSSWPVNDLRDPERKLSALLIKKGTRDGGKPVPAALASPSESTASQLDPLASPTKPILCPDGMTSSRRTVSQASGQQATGRTTTVQAPAAVPLAATEAPGAKDTPANFDPNPPSAKSITCLPPLPSLRSDRASTPPPSSIYQTAGWGPGSLQPPPATEPSVRNTNSDASIYSASVTDATRPLLADSEDAFIEPRSADVVLEPQAVPVIKASPAARHGADAGQAKISANTESTQRVRPSLHRRSSLPPSPELPPQRVAASRRQPTSVWRGTTRGDVLPQLPNTLRDLPPARMAELPRQIALQSSPQSLSPLPPHSPPPSLSQLPTQPATQPPPPSEPKLPPLHPRRNEGLAAAAEPATLRVTVRESRLLRTSENVVRVFSEHDSVCDVMLFNPREIAVIGKQQGTAKVEFWYDGQGLSRVSYLVSVDDGQNPETRPEANHRKVEKLIEYLFPKSRVKLVSDQDRLIVRGTAVNRREAVEIMSTVRRSQLIPVADEIVVEPEAK